MSTKPRSPELGPTELDEVADRARFRALVGALSRTVTAPDADVALGAGARAWFEADGLEEGDVAVLAAYPARRLLVYRKLVHAGLASALRAQMPRSVARLGDRLSRDVALYLAGSAPRSHYLRDIPRELVEHLAPAWRADPALPAFLPDLARHELSLFDVAAAPAGGLRGVDPDALELASPVALHPSARLLRYDFPVHLLSEGGEVLDPAPTRLLAYRDPEHEVRYLDLSPFGAALLARLLAADPLQTAVVAACQEAGLPLDEGALGRASQLLADLAERGVVLGARR